MSERKPLDQSEIKKERESLESRGRLYVSGKDSNFHYRWINLDEDQLFKTEQKLDMGYTLCTSDEFDAIRSKVPSELLRGSKVVGTYIAQSVGRGINAYLCKIPLELYHKRNEMKAKKNKEIENSLKQKGKEDGFYGSINLDA
jgi:hypothetical protein